MIFPSIKKNYAINAALTILNLAFPFATLAYGARIIGPFYLGKYYVASSLVTYFLFAATVGIPMYGAREIGRHRNDPEALSRIFSELALINLISSLAAGALFLGVTAAIPGFRKDWPLFLILGAMLPLNAISVDFLFMGLENQANIAIRTVFVKSLSLACLFFLVRRAEDYLWYAALATGSVLLNNLAAFPLAVKIARLRLSGLHPLRHMRPLAYLLLTVLAANVYLNLDSVVLGLLTDDTGVGYYNAAMRLARTTAAIVTAVGVTVIPRITYHLGSDNQAEYRDLLGKTFDLICLTALPACLMLGFCAPGIINLVFGARFLPAIPALEMAAPLILLTGCTHYLGMQVLFPKGDEKLVFLSALAAAVASLGLNFLLVPRFHYKGAVATALAAEALVLAFQLRWARRRHGQGLLGSRQTWKYLSAGAGMVLPLAVFRLYSPQTPLPLACILAGSGGLYLLILHGLGESHTRSSLALLGRIVNRVPDGRGR